MKARFLLSTNIWSARPSHAAAGPTRARSPPLPATCSSAGTAVRRHRPTGLTEPVGSAPRMGTETAQWIESSPRTASVRAGHRLAGDPPRVTTPKAACAAASRSLPQRPTPRRPADALQAAGRRRRLPPRGGPPEHPRAAGCTRNSPTAATAPTPVAETGESTPPRAAALTATHDPRPDYWHSATFGFGRPARAEAISRRCRPATDGKTR